MAHDTGDNQDIPPLPPAGLLSVLSAQWWWTDRAALPDPPPLLLLRGSSSVFHSASTALTSSLGEFSAYDRRKGTISSQRHAPARQKTRRCHAPLVSPFKKRFTRPLPLLPRPAAAPISWLSVCCSHSRSPPPLKSPPPLLQNAPLHSTSEQSTSVMFGKGEAGSFAAASRRSAAEVAPVAAALLVRSCQPAPPL